MCALDDGVIHRCILLPNEPVSETPVNLAESYHEELPDLRLWGLTLVSAVLVVSVQH